VIISAIIIIIEPEISRHKNMAKQEAINNFSVHMPYSTVYRGK
jgi:hypothetical protein